MAGIHYQDKLIAMLSPSFCPQCETNSGYAETYGPMGHRDPRDRPSGWRFDTLGQALLSVFIRDAAELLRLGSEATRVGRVILLTFDIGLHVGRRHQPHGVTKCLQLARPMVR